MRYFLFPILFIVLFSCTTVEVVEQNIQEEINEDENKVFINFLNSEWEKTLNNNPLFATYVGDKRSNNIINSNSIEQFLIEKDSSIESLNNLKKINFSKLNDENKLKLAWTFEGDFTYESGKRAFEDFQQKDIRKMLSVIENVNLGLQTDTKDINKI